MRITITARHIQTDQALEEHVRQRLLTLKKYFDRVIDAHVILSVEKYRHIAEITLKVSGLMLASKEQSSNLRTSVDRAVNKLERQVKRHKQRLTNHKMKTSKSEGVLVSEPEEFREYAEEEEEA